MCRCSPGGHGSGTGEYRATSFDWRKVCYDKNRQKKEVRDVIKGYAERIGKSGGAISTEPATLAQQAHHSLSLMAAGSKNPKFASEKEFRLVVGCADDGAGCDPTRYDSNTFRDFPGPIDFYDREGTLVPYTKIRLPHEAITSVWLGPRFGNVENEAALKLFLSKNGLRVPVQRSAATYR